MNRKIFLSGVLFIFLIISIIAALNLFEKKKMKKQIDNPFGVLEFLHWDHSWNNYKYPDKKSLEKAIALMKKAHVGWVRVDFLWSDIEPKQGDFQFKKYDRFVDLLNKNNIGILGVLQYSSDWASECGKWNCPPRDNSLFVNYCIKVIERYKLKVKFWEVWNEPDSSVYWNPQDGLKRYCALLKEVYIAAKKVDPECKILNGGFANASSAIGKLYENGVKDYFDIVNIHVFETPFTGNAIKRVLAYPKFVYKIMKRNGDADKKIWITEIGCPGVGGNNKTNNWWLGANPDEQMQAGWVKEVFTKLIRSEAVEKVFWAFFRDCNEHWKNGTDYFGLVRWDFSCKPSFFSYKESFEGWKKY